MLARRPVSGGASPAELRRPGRCRPLTKLSRICNKTPDPSGAEPPGSIPSERRADRLLADDLLTRQKLPGRVLPVLLRVEGPPACLEAGRLFRAEQARLRRIAIRDVQAGDLVVAFVLESLCSGCPDGGIDRRQRIASDREDADGL